MTPEEIQNLKKFFTITLAAFEFSKTVSETFGGTENHKSEAIRNLHKECLDELEKDNPSMEVINAKVIQLELLAVSPVVKTQFPKGGPQ